jgi:hypothetical protein
MARPRSKYPPQTAAQRQATCRAKKRGTLHIIPGIRVEPLPQLPGRPVAILPPPQPASAPPPTPPALPAPPTTPPALPAPPTTAIQKAASTDLAAPSFPDARESDQMLRLSLPPAVAARLKSLLDRHDSGKSLTPAERAEAQGLLDIAEYFVVQRLRKRLAA